MAKVKSPLFSIDAQGSISKTLTFRRHGAGTVVTGYSAPTGNKTAKQHAMRTRMQTLRSQWRGLPSSVRRDYHNRAVAKGFAAGYQFYIHLYLKNYLPIAPIYYGLKPYGRGKYL